MIINKKGTKVSLPINGQYLGCYVNTKTKPAIRSVHSYNNIRSTNAMCNNFCMSRMQTLASTANK